MGNSSRITTLVIEGQIEGNAEKEIYKKNHKRYRKKQLQVCKSHRKIKKKK